MCQRHRSRVDLRGCSVKCQPSEPCFSLATGRPRGFATPFLTCSIKTEEEEVIGFYCILLSSFFKKAKVKATEWTARETSATNSQGGAAFVSSEACTHVWSGKQTPQQKESTCCVSVMRAKCLDRKLNCSILGMWLAAARPWLMKGEIRAWSHHTQREEDFMVTLLVFRYT